MNVLFINLQGEYGFFINNKIEYVSPTPALGILYLAKILENEGHSVEVIEYSIEKNVNKVIKQKLKCVDFVGLSISTYLQKRAVDIVNFIKSEDTSIPIVIGGPHCIFNPIDALEDTKADICVEGEAELIISKIASAIKGKTLLSDIPGVHYHNSKNEIKQGPPPKLIYDLDSIPFPARHLVEKYDFGKIGKLNLFKQKMTSIITTRGCKYRCRFCPRNAEPYKTYRKRSAENVIQEIDQLDDKYKSLYIMDENFLTDKKRAEKIMDHIIDIGMDIDIHIYGSRVDSSDKNLYKKMKKAGVKKIHFGIESGNQDILNFYKKGITLEQIKKAIYLSRKMNFITSGYFIFGAPIETKKDIKNTTEFACSLPLDEVAFLPLRYACGSDLFEKFKENKADLIRKEDKYGFTADKNKGIGNFTKDELVVYCRKASKQFYSRPSFIFKYIYRNIKRGDINQLKIGWNVLKNN